MSRTKDITGQKFGRLTAVERGEKNRHNNYQWRCLCECGSEIFVLTSALLTGHTKSCGCLRREATKANMARANLASPANKVRHGRTPRKLYSNWCNMKQRCFTENHREYKNYGGRGIKVCDAWRNSFESFRDWALANGWEDTPNETRNTRKTIDRIDNDGDYCPENCRIVDMATQGRNRRSTILVDGVCLKDYCEKNKLPYQTILDRLHRGWSLDKALNTPVMENRRNRKFSRRE